ncbi:MAG TPA: hypothetical protein DCL41_05660 [Bdellovibrionales bacterium]|nr:hypothetical protein [Bdellovibrionales bacterium]|tara:strand:+ start:3505 stop:3714 length:210 start_codon:yes stop_codon:yes gene_type:complete
MAFLCKALVLHVAAENINSQKILNEFSSNCLLSQKDLKQAGCAFREGKMLVSPWKDGSVGIKNDLRKVH